MTAQGGAKRRRRSRAKAVTDEGLPTSQKVPEKCGFLREGTVRQEKMVSTWCDYHLYSLLKDDEKGGTFVIFSTRDEELRFLKRLWTGVPTVCPKCGGAMLEQLHKKAKKSNNDWQCPSCGEIFRTIRLFMELPEK